MKLTKIDWDSVNKETDADVAGYIGNHPKGFYGSAVTVGSVLSIAWIVALGAMLVTFGAWGWVIWPAVGYMVVMKLIGAVTYYKKKLASVAKA